MKTLHLTLKKKWFDMIDTGGKMEEYREKKTYWLRRLADGFSEAERNGKIYFSHPSKKFDLVKFRHGYAKNARTMTFKWHSTTLDYGRECWGAEPGKVYIIIKLGERIS